MSYHEAKTEKRMSPKAAGYMELTGAKKDADCYKVEVPGGVSKERGCCNEFKPETAKVTAFRCGNCKFVDEDFDAS